MSLYWFYIPFIPLLACVLLMLSPRTATSRNWYPFRWYLATELFFQIASSILAALEIRNLPLLYVYVPTITVLIGWFFARYFKAWLQPNIIWGILGIFLALCLADYLWISDTREFNALTSTIESLLVLIFTITAYLISLSHPTYNTNDPRDAGINWIVSGWFLYHASSVNLFYFGEQINSWSFPKAIGLNTWLLHAFFSTVMYLCFFLGLWKNRRQSNWSTR